MNRLSSLYWQTHADSVAAHQATCRSSSTQQVHFIILQNEGHEIDKIVQIWWEGRESWPLWARKERSFPHSSMCEAHALNANTIGNNLKLMRRIHRSRSQSSPFDLNSEAQFTFPINYLLACPGGWCLVHLHLCSDGRNRTFLGAIRPFKPFEHVGVLPRERRVSSIGYIGLFVNGFVQHQPCVVYLRCQVPSRKRNIPIPSVVCGR